MRCSSRSRGVLPGWPQGFGIIFDDLVAAVRAVVWFALLFALPPGCDAFLGIGILRIVRRRLRSAMT